MTRDEILRTLRRLVGEIAPEADVDALRADRDLREQVDIDSFDLLRLMVLLHETFGVDVPETDYQRLRTLDEAADYLAARSRR